MTRAERRAPNAGFSLIDTLAVVAIAGIVAAAAIPMSRSTIARFRAKGDAQTLHNTVSLARERAVARFTRVRVYADLTARSYRIEAFDKTSASCCWVQEGPTQALSSGVSFGFGSVGSAPPNTQTSLGLAAACTDSSGGTIGGTSCIAFNSRGVPISLSGSVGAPTGEGAFYLTDGESVYATKVSSGPLVRFWWSRASAAEWQRQ